MPVDTGEARQAAQPDAAWPLCHIPEYWVGMLLKRDFITYYQSRSDNLISL